MPQRTWAIVLAAGEGSRLKSLTTDSSGNAVPKQFCSLQGGPSLLQETLHRAQSVVERERVCAIVAAQHRRWWQSALRSLPRFNVVAQPRNRGTGNGILLAVLHVVARDPLARIVFLPADHYVRDDGVLARSLHSALGQLSRHATELILLGISPEDADCELGYIVPREVHATDAQAVERFVEKPDRRTARALIDSGGLWNSFIFAASGFTVLSLLRRRHPEIVDDMENAVARDADRHTSGAVAELYERLPEIDFSRHVIQGAEDLLRVVRVPQCGWNDLGTPQRVTQTLRHIRESLPGRPTVGAGGAWLNLAAAAEARLQLAG
jgi:mannose-1-phosphate guanylyltransferase